MPGRPPGLDGLNRRASFRATLKHRVRRRQEEKRVDAAGLKTLELGREKADFKTPETPKGRLAG